MESNNIRILSDEAGNVYKVEVIETFTIEQLNKTFMAYTLNDDGQSENVKISFVELIGADTEKPTIKAIDEDLIDTVIGAFNALVDQITA